MATSVAEKSEDDASTSQDRETESDVANTNCKRIVAVHVVTLGGPKHDNGEEVRAGDEGDDESEQEDSRLLSNPSRKHRVLGEELLVKAEGNKHDGSKKQRYEYVSGLPRVLVSAPLDAGHKEQETTN